MYWKVRKYRKQKVTMDLFAISMEFFKFFLCFYFSTILPLFQKNYYSNDSYNDIDVLCNKILLYQQINQYHKSYLTNSVHIQKLLFLITSITFTPRELRGWDGTRTFIRRPIIVPDRRGMWDEGGRKIREWGREEVMRGGVDEGVIFN